MMVPEVARANELETRLLMRNICNHLGLSFFLTLTRKKQLTIKIGGQFVVVVNFLMCNEGEWRKP